MKNFRKISLFALFALFCIGFLFVSSTQAANNKVQFTPKNIWVDFNGLPFKMNNWAPGDSGQKTIIIENNENFDINVYFGATSTPSSVDNNLPNLADVLIVTIDDKLSYLSDLFDGNISLTQVNSGKSQKYDIIIKFDENAENKYQDKFINFDFIITVEEIGGGNEEIPVIIPGGWGGGYTTTTTISPTTTTTLLPGEVAGEATKREFFEEDEEEGLLGTTTTTISPLKLVAGVSIIKPFSCPVNLTMSGINPLLASLLCLGQGMCDSCLNPWLVLLLGLTITLGSAILVKKDYE